MRIRNKQFIRKVGIVLVNIQRKNKGFTIIEVVLVLAIAGLIFMMVFIALPSLQRSQRDTQRKNDVSRLETAISSYTSNNRGSLPVSQADWDGFESSYLLTNNDSFVDPSGAGSSGLTGPVVNGAQSYLLKASTSDFVIEI